MGKNNSKPSAAEPTKNATRKPRHPGINSPKNVHKGFRSHGKLNSMVVKTAMGYEARKHSGSSRFSAPSKGEE